MQLDQLIHWRLVGMPDVFTEERDGHEWRVIHSGGAIHDAGFSQVVEFDRSIKTASLSCVASLYTANGGLMIAIGIDPTGGTDPNSADIVWSGWHGPDNGWDGKEPRRLNVGAAVRTTKVLTAFLQSQCRYPARANTSRWRDVQLEVEYAEAEPEPEPEPEPEQGVAGEIAKVHAEIAALLEKVEKRVIEVDRLLAEWDNAQSWIDTYNRNRGD